MTIKDLEEQYECKNIREIFQLLNQAYGEDNMNRGQCYDWFKRFKEAEHQLMEISGLDNFPHQRMITMSRKFVR